jgi:hypothetical protein
MILGQLRVGRQAAQSCHLLGLSIKADPALVSDNSDDALLPESRRDT